LSFLSVDAFRFYLPAYLIADIDEQVDTDVLFYLTHGLTDSARTEKVNPRRYGERTWFETDSYKMSVFNEAQVKAIIAYLEFMRKRNGFDREDINQALSNYWRPRANKDAGKPSGG
jgi:hypothetical protein